MTVDEVKVVVGRALLDAPFRARLLNEPDQALAEYDLTAEEYEALSSLTDERLRTVQNNVFNSLGRPKQS